LIELNLGEHSERRHFSEMLNDLNAKNRQLGLEAELMAELTSLVAAASSSKLPVPHAKRGVVQPAPLV